MHLLPSSPNWAGCKCWWSTSYPPHFAEFTKDAVWHQQEWNQFCIKQNRFVEGWALTIRQNSLVSVGHITQVMTRSYNFGALQISVSVVDSFILFHFVNFLGIFLILELVFKENWPHKCVKCYTNAVFICFIWNTFECEKSQILKF